MLWLSTIRFCLLIATVTVRATEANKEEKDDDSVFLRRYHLPGAGGSGPFEAVLDLISAFEAKYPEIDLTVSRASQRS